MMYSIIAVHTADEHELAVHLILRSFHLMNLGYEAEEIPVEVRFQVRWIAGHFSAHFVAT